MMEQRKQKRYLIRLPVRVLRRGTCPFFAQGETRNLSSRGVLFTSDHPLEVGERIEFAIAWPAGNLRSEPLDLYCLGKVLRVSSDAGAGRFTIAATVERYAFTRFQE
jgi:hypothetical protein